MKRFHFISGLPRSGSTLLAALLRQNPKFTAGMTSPVGSLFSGLIAQVSAGSEFSAVVSTDQRKRLLRGLFDGFYQEFDGEVIIDTNRLWTSQISAIVQLFPDAKFLCTVRDLAWIMDSMEVKYRENAFENTKLFSSPAERDTVYSRVETLANRSRLVGFAYSALKEACYGPLSDRLLIIEYELLTQAPMKVLKLIYDFIGEPFYQHDINNIDYDAPEFDLQLGVSGLHKIRPQVESNKRTSILPPDLFQQYTTMCFWRELGKSSANVIALKQQQKTSK